MVRSDYEWRIVAEYLEERSGYWRNVAVVAEGNYKSMTNERDRIDDERAELAEQCADLGAELNMGRKNNEALSKEIADLTIDLGAAKDENRKLVERIADMAKELNAPRKGGAS